MFGPDARQRAFLITNEAESVATFIAELKRLAEERGTIEISAEELLLGDIACQFGGGNGQIQTIYYRRGNFSKLFPTGPEVLLDLKYEAEVEGSGTEKDPFVISWQGESPLELAQSVLDDFIDFAIEHKEQ